MRRRYGCSICFTFLLSMESNGFEKAANSSVTTRFFFRIPSMIPRVVRICEVVEWFLRKPFWFLKNFLYFGLNTIDNSTSINLSNYSSKSYASVVLKDSEVAFLEVRKDTNFPPFHYCVSFMNCVALSEVIIIMSCHQHGYPWPSLATSPYFSSPLAGLQGYILYSHIAAVCMFELVVLLLLGHMWESIGVHHLCARPCFSSSVLHVRFVLLGWFSWWEAGDRIVGVLWGVTTRTYSILLATFSCLR